MGQLLHSLLLICLALGEVFDGVGILLLLIRVPKIAIFRLLLHEMLLLYRSAMLEGKIDSDEGKIVEKCVSLLVSDKLLQLWVDNSPEASLLSGPFGVHAVQESDVEDLSGLVPAVIEQLLVLEEGMLDVAVLFELSHVHLRF